MYPKRPDIMDDLSIKHLQIFYNSYKDQLVARKKMSSDSVLLSSMSVKSNERYRALNTAGISINDIPEMALMDLKNLGMIRNTDDILFYTISGKGIWYIEKNNGAIDDIQLINFIDQMNFDLFEADKQINDKEKVIIFTLLATRAFSEKSAVDMRKDDMVKDAWKDALETCFNKLKTMKVLAKLEIQDLFVLDGVEHPASHLIRHTDSLPKKTKGLFKAAGKNKYYLEISQGEGIAIDKIGYLFWLVFGNLLNTETIDGVEDLCQQMSYNTSIHVFDLSQHIYSKPKFDEVLHEGMVYSTSHMAEWEVGKAIKY